jgi:pimeloyl-ACP methyl ester carboxylesterase
MSDRRLLSAWTIRGAAGLLLLVIAPSVIGAVFEHFAEEADSMRFRPNGQMIAVDGHQFHILCKGDGTPTAILEPGLGLPSLVWAWVQAEVANTSRVCIYDRAGYGWSEPTEAPMNAENVSKKLHELLKGGNISGPYVLVGHSVGAAYMGIFATKYPKAAAGLVLIDPTTPVGCGFVRRERAINSQEDSRCLFCDHWWGQVSSCVWVFQFLA